MRLIDRNALFCDETADFRIPPEADAGECVRLMFRTAKNGVDDVFYIEQRRTENAKAVYGQRLTFSHCDELFDYYRIEITVGLKPVRYCFQIEKREGSQQDICFYNRFGVVETPPDNAAFCITPGFHIPEWIKGAVMYQIFVDRFCNGDPGNDVETNEYVYLGQPVKRVTDWDSNPEPMDVGRFYGGDLKGVWDKLEYLKSLKVEVIYLNPVFVSPSNHKYDCQDYDHIDPHFTVIPRDGEGLVDADATDNRNAGKYAVRTADAGNLKASDRFFADFVQAAHDMGIRVILDGVFNHCGSFNKWMDAEQIYKRTGDYHTGAYIYKTSPYAEFFKFNDKDGWPLNKSYDGWWGHDTLPKLNYEESPELYRYILKVAQKWVSPPFNADGWRLDVAADLGRSPEFNHRFWKDFRKAVKAANPDAVILAEHYGDASEWLKGDEWDTIMNYDAFMEPVSWFLTGMEKHSRQRDDSLFGNGTAFFDAMNYHMSRMQTQSVLAAMNELSNHDHSRFMTRSSRRVGTLRELGAESAAEGISYGIFRQGVVISMTWPGAPTIYYGDETGLCGWTDPDNRRTYPWGREDLELIEFHRYMTGIRERNPACRTGSVKSLLAGYGMIAYGRFQGNNKCVILVNTDDHPLEFAVPVWQIGITDHEIMKRVMLTYEEGYNAGHVLLPVVDGNLVTELPARSSAIFSAEKE